MYKIEVYLPKEILAEMIDELSIIGACRVGGYDNVASYFEVEGCWKPTNCSNPYSGRKNVLNYGNEYKLEFRCEEHLVSDVLRKIKEIHPYEEAVINVIKIYNYLFE